MKKNYSKTVLMTLLLAALVFGYSSVSVAFAEDQKEEKQAAMDGKREIAGCLQVNGTGKSATFTVNARALLARQPISITTSAGFTVTPSTLPADARNEKVTVTLNSYKPETKGMLVLRSGDMRVYVELKGIGTPLAVKDISRQPVYDGGTTGEFVKTVADGFQPTSKGYTIEFKVNTDGDKEFYPYVVNDEGIGFRAYITSSEMGLYHADSKRGIRNPANSVEGGSGRFYNDDNRSHTYRYAVTPDNRVFIYRDGMLLKIVRAVDFGLQADMASEIGDPVENLLRNPGFEGEYETEKEDSKFVVGIEGWDILIGDKYNSEQYVPYQEIDNRQDQDNHILQMKRYMWSGGWSAAEVAQVVNVAPNETYTLSALARGGRWDGKLLGKIKVEEVQDKELGASVSVTSEDWETYSMDYTTSASCKQLRTLFYLERAGWGAHVSPLEVDNVRLMGKAMVYGPKIGFVNKAAGVDYFTYDLSGAYAPLQPELKVSIEGEIVKEKKR